MSRNWNAPSMAPLYARLYGGAADRAAERYAEMESRFFSFYGEGPYRVFSAPGRSEIGGNHTDHNYGKVLACAVTVDTVAFARPSGNSVVRYRSAGYRGEREFKLDLADTAPRKEDEGTTNALIRGVAQKMEQLGYRVGGFDAYISSDVLRGSGLSSSAAMEVVVCAILDGLFNRGDMSPILRAQISQYAENVHFGKPSGLMDQMASSVGALVKIDFADPQAPVVERVDVDLSASGLNLVVVDTGGSHAGLTDAYAGITEDMAQAAAFFGKEKLRQIEPEQFFARIPQMVGQVSDRAILRAIHFYNENARVDRQVDALKRGDIPGFLENMIASGDSSWELLQNVYVSGSSEQKLSLALALSRPLLQGSGAWRVHGGGFAGTIQAFVPKALLKDYVRLMDAVFHEGAATVLSVRPEGALEIQVP
jgi:galactokinase